MRVLAVDISGVFSQFWEVDNGRGRDFDKPRVSTVAAIRRFREGHDRVAICCDSGRSFRTQIWESYKANRTDRGEAYRAQLAQTIEALSQDGCSVFKAPKYSGDLYAEADDVIGSLCQWAYESGHSVTILSSDKDLLQLVNSQVCVLRPLDKEHKLYDEAAVLEKFGLPPCKIPDYLALAGDVSDNFKPYPGIGDTRAVALVSKYGHALGMFDGAVVMAELVQLLGQKLAESFVAAGPEPARKALQVATIVRDLPLDFERLTGEPVRTAPEEEQQTMNETTAEPQRVEPAVSETALQHAAPQTPSKAEAAQSVERSVAHHVAASFPGCPYWMQEGFISNLWRVASAFFQAGLFPNFANAQQIMTVGMMAFEDGIGIATALQHAYPVYGRLCWSATYLLMRAESSGTVEVFDVVTSTDKECVIRCRRKGRAEKIVKFAFDEAVRAGLVKAGGNWTKWPVEMLLARCIARALRQEWRDKVGGRYVPEELEAPLAEDDVLTNARDVRRALSEPHTEAKAA